MINGRVLPVLVTIDELASAILELQRRAVDGTVVPLFVDYTNQRIVIGGISVSASPAKVEIVAGDLKIVTAGSGVIIPNRSGTAYYRIIMEDDGAIAADPI